MINLLLEAIVSGGQTGVDRAALDWAITNGVPHGGFCPKHRKAEDGRIPDRYNLQECVDKGYPERTRLNVISSGLTLIITPDKHYAGKGTVLTRRLCRKFGAVYFDVDASDKLTWACDLTCNPGSNKVIVNVAGPRAHAWPEGYAITLKILTELFFLT